MGNGGDRADVFLADRVVALHSPRQEQDLLLDVGRQVEEVHDLRDPRTGHIAEPGQVSELVRGSPSVRDGGEGFTHQLLDSGAQLLEFPLVAALFGFQFFPLSILTDSF